MLQKTVISGVITDLLTPLKQVRMQHQQQILTQLHKTRYDFTPNPKLELCWWTSVTSEACSTSFGTSKKHGHAGKALLCHAFFKHSPWTRVCGQRNRVRGPCSSSTDQLENFYDFPPLTCLHADDKWCHCNNNSNTLLLFVVPYFVVSKIVWSSWTRIMTESDSDTMSFLPRCPDKQFWADSDRVQTLITLYHKAECLWNPNVPIAIRVWQRKWVSE